MASVWIARLVGGHGFEKYVAVKTILPQFASDARFQKMFIEESRIASRIEHANVAQIRDVGETDGVTYLVMEYVDGESLWALHRGLLRKGSRLPAGILLRIMADVCGGLHAAHELRDLNGALVRVVHRDVSPQNVLVGSSGAAKLIDFGIAKSLDGAPSDTTTGPLKGKVRYMAPEQARGEPLDRRADIWAVGAVLYYLLSGKAPCEGENEVATLVRLRTSAGADPLPPGTTHPAIEAAIMKALGMTPASRYPVAAEMQRALENAMEDAGVTTSSSGVAAFLAEHAAESAQKRKNAIALGLKTAADRSSSALPLEPLSVRTTSSIPPAATGSTMRAAAVEVTQAPPNLGRGFPTVPVVLGGLVVLAAVGVAARLTRHPASPAAISTPAMALPPAVSGVSAAPAATSAPAPSSTATPSNPGIRTIDISELPAVPSAAAVAQRTPYVARSSPPSLGPAPGPGITPAPAAKPAASTHAKVPDDGF
jgi:serine/threonine protein kinase